MKIQIVSRKLIKPRTPTPQNLKHYKLSFKDELSPPSNFGFVLFYESKPESVARLEHSLSEILLQFYPLAGRFIKNDYYIDCSDQGAELVEAVLHAKDIVGEVEDLLPRRCDQLVGPADPLLSVQITDLIECGGSAIAVSMSHRIFDAASIGTFITAWTNASRGGKLTIIPSFDARLLFPGMKKSYYIETDPSETTNVVSKRFLFKKESIMTIRSKLNPKQGVNNALSKVRVVSAVIAKTLIRIDLIKHGHSRPCFVIHAIDMRQRTIPHFPAHSCGNLALHSVAKCMHAAKTLGIQELVDMIGDAIEKKASDCAKVLCLGEDGFRDMIINPELDLIEGLKSCEVNDIWFSDWSKFGLYEADFGWGKPSVVMAAVPQERVIVLMNNKDGDGIEAWVHLKGEDMYYFEQDEDIKMLTT